MSGGTPAPSASPPPSAGRRLSLPVYLDYNATTPVDSGVVAAMEPYLREHFGNPASTHGFGAVAAEAVAGARARLAALLGCRAEV